MLVCDLAASLCGVVLSLNSRLGAHYEKRAHLSGEKVLK